MPRLRNSVAFAALVGCALWAVLVVMPYRQFDLDRFLAPKEVALHAAALVAGLALLAGAARASLGRADLSLMAWMALSAASALFATNHRLAFRALAVTVSSVVVFWAARRLASAALGGALVRALAAAVVVGAVVALAQAYGVTMEFAALNRAPGGTFGNRNFMAHLTAVGVPLLLYCIATSRTKLSAGLWTVALATCAAALVLSRTRAAWLALAVCALPVLLLLMHGPTLLEAPGARRRLAQAGGAVALAVIIALFLPNSLDWKSENPYLESVVGVVNYHEGSGRGRVMQYAHSARMALSHPLLGVGTGNWAVDYPRYAPPEDPSLVAGTGTTANPWPSSDWMAQVSERGIPALLALMASVALLLGGAVVVRYDESRSPTARLAAVTGTAALTVAVIEGGFDAVLLLPAPALIVWAAAGALLPVRHEMRSLTFMVRTRIAAMLALGAFGALAIGMSVRRVEAMRLASLGTTAALESAVDHDRGSYRLRLRAAENYAAHKQCDKAREHALVARELMPQALVPKRLLELCR